MAAGILAAAMLSVWLTDFTGWFSLSRTVAGLASIGALAASIPWPMHLDKTSLVTAVANFLMYVQVIHLFQRKSPRIYWALVRFSVLQVVVAALLAQPPFYGVLLVVYVFAALLALAMLFLHSERLRHPGTTAPAAARGGSRWPLSGRKAEFASPVPGRLAVQREFFRRVLWIAAASFMSERSGVLRRPADRP